MDRDKITDHDVPKHGSSPLNLEAWTPQGGVSARDSLKGTRDKETYIAAYAIPGFPGMQNFTTERMNDQFWHDNFIKIQNPSRPQQIVDALIAQAKEHKKLLGDIRVGVHGAPHGEFVLGYDRYSFGDPKVLSAFSQLKKYLAPGSRITFQSCEAGADYLAPIGLQKLANATGAKVRAFEWIQVAGDREGTGPYVEKAPCTDKDATHLDEKTINYLTYLVETRNVSELERHFKTMTADEAMEAMFIVGNRHDNAVVHGTAKDDILIGAEKTNSGTRIFVDTVTKHASLLGISNMFFPDRKNLFHREMKGPSVSFKNDFANQWGAPREPGTCDEWY